MKEEQKRLAKLNEDLKKNPCDAHTLARRAEIYQQMGCYEEALVGFNRAIELEPTYAWALAHRGETYRLLNCLPESLADFNRAIELNPTYTWPLAHRGATYRQMKNYSLALRDFNRAIELSPTYAWAIFYRARIYELMGRFQETLRDADRAIALDKNIISNWRSHRGVILSYLGRLSEAVVEWELELQENPEDHLALYQLAVYHVRQQKKYNAEKNIQQARARLLSMSDQSEPEHMVFYLLGGLAALEGQAKNALAYLANAIALDHEPILHARYDSAWDNLRTSQGFKKLINIKANI